MTQRLTSALIGRFTAEKNHDERTRVLGQMFEALSEDNSFTQRQNASLQHQIANLVEDIARINRQIESSASSGERLAALEERLVAAKEAAEVAARIALRTEQDHRESMTALIAQIAGLSVKMTDLAAREPLVTSKSFLLFLGALVLTAFGALISNAIGLLTGKLP